MTATAVWVSPTSQTPRRVEPLMIAMELSNRVAPTGTRDGRGAGRGCLRPTGRSAVIGTRSP